MALPQRLPPWEEREDWSDPPAAKSSRTLRRAIACAIVLLLAVGLIVSWAHTITPSGIVVHHTGPFGNGGPVTPALLDDFHKSRGFGAFYYGTIYHVAYHYVIFPDGRVMAGRLERLRGAHTLHFNSYLGIALVGDFSRKDNPRGELGLQQPTEAQLSALVLLCRRLERRHGIALGHVYPHRELGQTLCPGIAFPGMNLPRGWRWSRNRTARL